jgi:hypothetical protein
MKRLIATRKRKALVGITLVVLIAASAGFAAWLISTPNGSGRGKVATLVAPTVSGPVSFTGGGDLVPGGNGSAQVLVTNPNSVPLTLVSAGDAGNAVFVPTNTGTCPAANFSMSPSGSTSATPASVPANAVNLPVTISGLIRLAAAAPTGCQGQEVAINGGIIVNWTT